MATNLICDCGECDEGTLAIVKAEMDAMLKAAVDCDTPAEACKLILNWPVTKELDEKKYFSTKMACIYAVVSNWLDNPDSLAATVAHMLKERGK